MYDLIIVGGGLTGIAAAYGAAREGLSVLLLEKSGFLGGAAGNCYVNPFMPYTIQRDGKPFVLSRGLFLRLLEELKKKNGFHTNQCTFSEEILKLVLDDLMEEAGVQVLFHTTLTSVQVTEDTLTGVQAITPSGLLSFEGKYFLDATGDANLSVLAGCDFHLGRENDHLCQPMTLCFRISNIELEKMYAFGNDAIHREYQAAQADGRITNPREDILKFAHMSPGVLHFNSTRVVKMCPVDVYEKSIAERQARRQMYELYTFLKQSIPGFENSVLLASAPEIGVRESRMIEGLYTITAEDLLECRPFEDSICVGAYDMDIHNPDGSGTTHLWIPEGQYYHLPYRALVPKGKNNLLAAGRCISSTHEAQASYRILPICCCMGEAAGIAIGTLCKEGKNAADANLTVIHEKMDQYGLLY